MATCSVELFTPRTPQGIEELSSRIEEFAKRGPSFIGINGTDASSALAIAEGIRARHCIRPQLHVQRTGSTQASVTALLDAALKVGTRDVLLLGGNPGTLNAASSKLPGAFGSTAEMVAFVKGTYGDQLRVAVCGFPRSAAGEAGEYAADLAELVKQVAAGAESVVCLPTFDASEFASYVADCAKSNLSCQMLPGLLPIRDHEEFRRICRALHLTPPTWLSQRLSSGDGASVVGDQVFRSLVADLKALGHASVHVYSLNAASTVQLLDAAGYKPLAHRCGR